VLIRHRKISGCVNEKKRKKVGQFSNFIILVSITIKEMVLTLFKIYSGRKHKKGTSVVVVFQK
jgi:hypothetical protein